MTHVLEVDGVRAEIDPDLGGRLAVLRVDGLDLLVGREQDPLAWGCYPMAPFAGRVRDGRFAFRGETHELPISLPPHAIHGTVWRRPWRVESASATRIELAIELGPDWPWSGVARQTLRLDPDAIALRLALESRGEAFPASLGWHPWFVRRLARGEPARLDFAAGAMYRRDAAGIPDGTRIPPPLGPWDDCFTDLLHAPRLHWPGALTLELWSSLDHWVVYDEPRHAICVEPQSGPPDALNIAPRRVTPDDPLRATFWIGWRRHVPGASPA